MRSNAMRLFALAVVSAACALMSIAARAASWPQHRGPDRNGITSEQSGWNGSSWQLTKLWQVNVGMGCTSPLISGGRVYVMGWRQTGSQIDSKNWNGTDDVWCLDASNGSTVWKKSYSQSKYVRCHTYDESYYGGPNATPTYDESSGYLFTHGIAGDFRCYDSNGNVKWSMNIYDAYSIPQNPEVYDGTHNNDYGCISSPLVIGNRVYLEVGSPSQGLLMGFNKSTGNREWTSSEKTWAGQSPGPQLITVGGVQCLATLTLEHIKVIRIDNGNTIGACEWKAGWDENHSMPCIDGANIWITGHHWINGGRDLGASARFEATLSGMTQKWKGAAWSKVTGLTVDDGRAYISSGKLTCVNAWNSNLLWEDTESTGQNTGCGATVAITGDNKIVYFSQYNTLYLAEVGDSYTRLDKRTGVISSASGQTWPHVAIGEGRILVKDKGGNLACYGTGGGATIDPPSVSTNDASNVGTTTARLNGNLNSTGGENPTVKIYWGDNDAGTTAGNWDHEENLGTKGTGAFYKDVSGLTPNTTYYFRCYASNSAGGTWASSGKSFTTDQQISAPGVTTKDATNITTSAARLNGEVTSTGNENPTVKVYWGDNDGGTTAGSWDHEESLGTKGTGTFYKDVSGLASGTTYYVRCYASNSAGGTWASSTKSFTTADPANASPSASIASPSDGATFTAGDALSYNGSASDPEDGTLTGGSLAWEIDRVGDGLGAVHTSTGTSGNYAFPSDLAADTTYYVTLTATDSGGATATDSHTITVSPIPSSDQPCSVDITTPSNNATVSGTLAVNAVAYDPDVGPSDGDGILSVVFELRSGSTVVASHQENALTYDWSVDTTAYADGSYVLRAVATSTAAAGGTQATDEVSITVANDGGGVTVPLRINCGDNAYDAAGWVRDDAYITDNADWVNPSDVDTSGVTNAAPATVYKSVAHQDHSYDIPVPDGTYTLRMHFADHYGDRDMTYTVEGQVVIDHLDIVTEAGGADRALVRDVAVTVSDGNGMQILCSGNGGDVFEAGLEILATGGPAPTITILSLSCDQLAGKQDVTVTWTSDLSGNVSVEFTDDGWSSSTVVVASTANDGSHTWQVANTDSIDCYVRVSDAADGDPADEYGPFSVSAIADVDGDRIDDAWEIEHFGDTTTTDGTTDADDDGVTDLVEFWNGGDPSVAEGGNAAFSCAGSDAAAVSAWMAAALAAALLLTRRRRAVARAQRGC